MRNLYFTPERGRNSHLVCPARVWTRFRGPAHVVLEIQQAGTPLGAKMFGVRAAGQCPRMPIESQLSVHFYTKSTAFSPVFKTIFVWLVFRCFHSYLIIPNMFASIYIV